MGGSGRALRDVGRKMVWMVALWKVKKTVFEDVSSCKRNCTYPWFKDAVTETLETPDKGTGTKER